MWSAIVNHEYYWRTLKSQSISFYSSKKRNIQTFAERMGLEMFVFICGLCVCVLDAGVKSKNVKYNKYKFYMSPHCT